MTKDNEESGFGPNTQRESFVSLITANHTHIYAYIITMVPNDSDADDIMQETATLLWKNFNRFEHGTNFVAWAVAIAKFQVLKYRKTKYRNRSRLLLSNDAIDLLISETQKINKEETERLSALRKCLKKLSEKDRQFLKLRYGENTAAKEVARKVGLSIDAVYRKGARLIDSLLLCIRGTLKWEI
jgi:RNA polymerase sigma-70 factor (ECF subfamily)